MNLGFLLAGESVITWGTDRRFLLSSGASTPHLCPCVYPLKEHVALLAQSFNALHHMWAQADHSMLCMSLVSLRISSFEEHYGNDSEPSELGWDRDKDCRTESCVSTTTREAVCILKGWSVPPTTGGGKQGAQNLNCQTLKSHYRLKACSIISRSLVTLLGVLPTPWVMQVYFIWKYHVSFGSEYTFSKFTSNS